MKGLVHEHTVNTAEMDLNANLFHGDLSFFWLSMDMIYAYFFRTATRAQNKGWCIAKNAIAEYNI